MENLRNTLEQDGFCVIENIYTPKEVENLIMAIEQTETSKATFRKTQDLFAIRQFHKEIPETLPLIFNTSLKNILQEQFGKDYFITKSIYFDKPANSNWFVAYHQDLTISVNKKAELADYQGWIQKHNQYSVQPPISLLEKNFTIRIHLDDTTAENGALKVIPQSHLKGMLRAEIAELEKNQEMICRVGKGGIMLMKPLLLHASSRTSNQKRRRVIHIEFSNQTLPQELEWSEKCLIEWTK